MIRRLIRWLARKEIAEAYEAGALAENAEQRSQIAFALGQMQGHREAFDAIDDEVKGRPVTLEDVKAARRRGKH